MRFFSSLYVGVAVCLLGCGSRSDLLDDSSTTQAVPLCSPGDPPVSMKLPFVGEIVAYGSQIYVASVTPGTMVAVPKTFGTPKVLITNAQWNASEAAHPGSHDGPYGPVVDGSGIYFRGFPYAFAVPRSGGVPRKISWGDVEVTHQLAVDASYAYSFVDGSWRRQPKPGGPATALDIVAPPKSYITWKNVAVTSTELFWAEGSSIWSAPKQGGTPALRAELSPRGSDQLRLDGDTLYFADEGLGDPKGLIGRIAPGGEAEILVNRAPSDFAVSRGELYWAEWTTGGAIFKLGADGEPVALHPLEAGAFTHAIAVDDSCVYWLSVVAPGQSTLTRAPR